MGSAMSYDEYFPRFVDHFRHLGNVKERTDRFSCTCPVCGDTRGKFQITNVHDKYLMNCFNCVGDGGFNHKLALNVVGLEERDMHPPNDEPKRKSKTQIDQREHIYRTPAGDVFAKKIIKKFDDGSKSAYWKRYENGKYLNGLNNQKAPLFRIDEVLSSNSHKLYVAEGEKDVDTLVSMDLVATTFPNGGSQTTWIDSFSEPFTGKQVIILTDNDDVGRKYGEFVSTHICDVAKEIRIISSPDIYHGVGKKGDITDIVDLVGIKEAKKLLMEAEKRIDPLVIDKPLDLDRFHVFTGKNPHPSDTIDAEIVEDIITNNYIRVMEGIPYLYNNGVLVQDRSGTMAKAMIKDYIYKPLQTINRINRIYGLLVIQQEIQISLSECNQQPKRWINFRNGFLDVKTMELIPHSASGDKEYNALNQIPYEWHGDPNHTDSISRKHIRGLIPDDDDREMFYEYIGYSMTMETGLQKFLILAGKGNTGKSTLLRLTEKAIGKDNYTNLKLQQIGGRFNTVTLMGKLMNIAAELPSADMKDVAELKRLTGEDTCTGEYKGIGAPFSFRSYARLLFSANELPKNRDDRSNAYYRRLMIIRIKQRGEFIPDLEAGLEDDVEQFIYDCVVAYNRALQFGSFVISNNSKKAVMELYLATDTVFAFLHQRTIDAPESRVLRSVLYCAYKSFCEEGSTFDEKTPFVWSGTFYANLRSRGYTELTVNGERYFVGLQIAPMDYDPPELSLNEF